VKADEIYDIAIIGCGPAGLSAAINARVRNKSLKIFGGEFCSPKLYSSPKINNYLGFPEIKGSKLRDLFLEHVQKMDINIERTKVVSIFKNNYLFELQTREGETYKSRTIILAVGVTSTDTLPGEEALLGRGVSYCATCDAAFFKGKEVAVVAYESEGEHEAKFLAGGCKKVYFIPLYKNPPEKLGENIEIVKGKPTAVVGEKFVQFLELGQERLEVQGIFIIRETVPMDRLLPGLEMTEDKFIKVNLDMETNIPGVFAAGDCVGKPFQLAKAVGQGQVAALKAADFLN